jgi:hypothetical protein
VRNFSSVHDCRHVTYRSDSFSWFGKSEIHQHRLMPFEALSYQLSIIANPQKDFLY